MSVAYKAGVLWQRNRVAFVAIVLVAVAAVSGSVFGAIKLFEEFECPEDDAECFEAERLRDTVPYSVILEDYEENSDAVNKGNCQLAKNYGAYEHPFVATVIEMYGEDDIWVPGLVQFVKDYCFGDLP